MAKPIVWGRAEKFSGAPAEPAAWLRLHDLTSLLFLYSFRLLLAAGIPQRALYWIADPLFQLRFRSRERAVRALLAALPDAGLGPGDASRFTRQCISKIAEAEVDVLLLANTPFQNRLRCESIEGLEHLRAAQAVGKGVLLLTGHFHANRAAKRYLGEMGYPVLSVRWVRPDKPADSRFARGFLRPLRNGLLDRALDEQALARRPDCAIRVLKRLREGGLVSILLDGSHFSKAVAGSFLGAPWRFSAGYFDLVRHSGCVVLPMLCSGNAAGFRIRFDAPIDPVPAADADEFAQANAPLFVGIIERQIQEQPAEWGGWIKE